MLKTIDRRDFQANQSWCRKTLLAIGETRLSVDIRYNAYDYQSHGHISRWDGSKWQRVAEIPYPQLAGVSREVSYGQKDTPLDSFQCDEDDLVDLALAILGESR